MTAPAPPLLRVDAVDLWVVDDEGRRVDLLRDVSWTVGAGEAWVLLGPNGAGKSSLVGLAGAARRPSRGTVEVLGQRLGRVDMRALRGLVGVVEPRLDRGFPPGLPLEQVVLSGLVGGTLPPLHGTDPAQRERARGLLADLGCGPLADRRYGDCSAGERQRAQIARALLPDPRLLLLDEPGGVLDLPAREALLTALDGLHTPERSTVVVTHHLEDVPATTTHALLLRGGGVVAAGPVEEVLTPAALSDCFGLPLEVERRRDRWTARAARSAPR